MGTPGTHSGTGFVLGEALQEPDPCWCGDRLHCWIPQPGVARAWSKFATVAKGGGLPAPLSSTGLGSRCALDPGIPRPALVPEAWCACVGVCGHVHVCPTVHKCLCACMYKCACMFVCMHVRVRARPCACKFMCACMSVCACVCMLVCPCVNVHTFVCTCVRVCVCTELQGQEEPCSRGRSLQLTLHPGPACT